MVAMPGFMAVDQVAQIARIEIAGIEQHRTEHGVAYPRAQRPAEPGGQRHRKAAFGAVQYLVRQQGSQGFLEDVLALAALELDRRRQPAAPFDELVVEQSEERRVG